MAESVPVRIDWGLRSEADSVVLMPDNDLLQVLEDRCRDLILSSFGSFSVIAP